MSLYINFIKNTAQSDFTLELYDRLPQSIPVEELFLAKSILPGCHLPEIPSQNHP